MIPPILYFDGQAARRERISAGCRALSIEVRPAASLAEAGTILAAERRTELFLAAFPRLDAAKSGFLEGLKSARPELSIIVLAESAEDGEAGRLVSGDILAGIVPPTAESVIPAFVRCELRRHAGTAKAEACGRMLRKLRAAQSRLAWGDTWSRPAAIAGSDRMAVPWIHAGGTPVDAAEASAADSDASTSAIAPSEEGHVSL